MIKTVASWQASECLAQAVSLIHIVDLEESTMRYPPDLDADVKIDTDSSTLLSLNCNGLLVQHHLLVFLRLTTPVTLSV